MILGQLQQAAASLAARAWPEDVGDPNLTTRLLTLLLEEAGELAQTVRKTAGPRLGHPGEAAASIEQVEDEIGDVLFLLARIALATGTSLEAAAWRVIGKIERRIANAETLEAGVVVVPVEEYEALVGYAEELDEIESRMGNYSEQRTAIIRTANTRLQQNGGCRP